MSAAEIGASSQVSRVDHYIYVPDTVDPRAGRRESQL